LCIGDKRFASSAPLETFPGLTLFLQICCHPAVWPRERFIISIGCDRNILSFGVGNDRGLCRQAESREFPEEISVLAGILHE
jgi:hypothetical protein